MLSPINANMAASPDSMRKGQQRHLVFGAIPDLALADFNL
jgi:hypothetical protein